MITDVWGFVTCQPSVFQWREFNRSGKRVRQKNVGNNTCWWWCTCAKVDQSNLAKLELELENLACVNWARGDLKEFDLQVPILEL